MRDIHDEDHASNGNGFFFIGTDRFVAITGNAFGAAVITDMMTSSRGLRVGIAAHIFASVVMVTVYTESTMTSSLGGYTEEALRRLSQVFGIGNVPKLHKRKTAPEYMVELYRSVAFSDGITKRANPYDADVVRGFPDRGKHPSAIGLRRHLSISWRQLS